jgi:hypothetical protein
MNITLKQKVATELAKRTTSVAATTSLKGH